MKRNQILIGLAMVICAGLGVLAITKFHGASSGADDQSADENEPALISVQVGALQRVTLHRYVDGYGMVEAAPAIAGQPAAGGPLAAGTAGTVAEVKVVAGQPVKKGEVLVELNSGSAGFKYAKEEVERQQKLFAQQNTSLKNLEDAKAQFTALQVVAPVSGTVTSVNVQPGQAVDAGTVVAEVIDLSRLAVSSRIPAANAGELRVGQEVHLLTTPPVATSLSWVSPAVDPGDGTVLAWAMLPPGTPLRPGQFVQLQMVTAVQTNCLSAPAESVVTDENGQSTIALVNDDEATQIPVRTGFREGGWVEVSGDGLKEGDSVVTVGAYGLPDKTKIKIVGSPGETNSPGTP